MRRFIPVVALLVAVTPVWTAAVAGEQPVPLLDGVGLTYKGFALGLYPEGNEAPADHRAAGRAQAGALRPLDADGLPHSTGKIVLLSIGMSNTTQEFCSRSGRAPCDPWTFVGQALADGAVDRSHLVLANGARGGQSAGTWDAPERPNYVRVREEILAPAGLSESQVQAAWVKVANPRPAIALPAADADAWRLVEQIGRIVRAMKVHYPNLRLIFLSSRVYGGYATTTLNPEPYAYESGLAVKWLIESQIRQRRGEADPTGGRAGDLGDASTAPWIGWGPYLWASGTAPRSDGLTWEMRDFAADGTHPSRLGAEKVGRLLLEFFKTSPYTREWFVSAARRRPVDHP
ncbi:MAG TPA: hypothetical protein VMS56_09150 [Thermoanaerobaculia bacterium]|nr:hypothetical protein [Thermoanaerobaculia bacterium]